MDLSAGAIPSRTAPSASSPQMIWVMRCLCLVGLGISAYLAWAALTMSPAFGCGGGEIIDCGHVLTSKWSKVLGIPVSIPAIGLYASLLAMLAFVRPDAPPNFLRLVWSGLTAGALMAGLTALWFIGLQVLVLEHLCPYCLAVHTCGIVLAALMLRNQVCSLQQKSLVATLSVAAVATLVTIQVITPESDNFTVVRYDDAAMQGGQEFDSASGQADLFAAPGEVFEAPGELIAAPGENVEAPAESSSSQQAGIPDAESTEDAVKAELPGISGASTLLLIMPARAALLTQLSFAVLQEDASSENPASGSSDTATDEKKDEPTSEGEATAEDSATKETTEPKDSNAPTAAVPAAPKPKLVTVGGNRISLNVHQWPVLGNPDARYVFVEMFDYTCPHCRNTHHAVKGALKRYGDDLAIVALPVPLEAACNAAASGGGHPGACELAKIAVTVWRVDPSKFREFHDWVFESHATAATARKRAEDLVGMAEFRKEFSSKIPGDYIKRHVDLYVKVGSGSVPKLMFPQSTMTGEVNSIETLCNTIERELVTVVRK